MTRKSEHIAVAAYSQLCIMQVMSVVNDDMLENLAKYLELKTDLGRDVLEEALRLTILFDKKQQDYGSDNISAFGEKGVVVRTNDKMERLKTLVWNDNDPNNEKVIDTWDDLAVYGIIGGLCHRDMWRTSE